ncbi:formate dehydrogenase [Litoreibacter roseus]|uniref:Formate dehydrogenase n=2 Tax=Litoreibacter roseus TaxID=2601869 RepID=A0A6N6JCW9_9RHOB|nr:formate/nitrite transporter family protein [Litoreibacter roseus]GFE63944.1 formate dehydrogenase [Litoreibacter roseus]
MTKSAAQIEQDDREEMEEAEQEEAERQSVKNAASLTPKLIYQVIAKDGEEELARPTRSLIWSGIAAGIMISFSVLGEAIFRTYLPDAPSSFLIENMGYSLGFLLVIIGRMQLFTENTITTVLPLMAKPTLDMLGCVARLWGIVLAANVVGAFAVAALYAFTPAIPANLLPAITELSVHATSFPPVEAFFRAVPAGILVAAIVWMLPQAEEASFFVIFFFTWLIAAGDFTHIVAGSVEMAFLMLQGDLGLSKAVFGFFIPVFLGNVVGGTVIFALMAWGQVRDEMQLEERRSRFR